MTECMYPWNFDVCAFHTNFATHVSICAFGLSMWKLSFHLPRYKTFRYRKARNFGGAFWPRCIFGAKTLVECAVTRSLKDGCFQANLLNVFVFSLPFPRNARLETLIDDLGSFPFDIPPSRRMSVCQSVFTYPPSEFRWSRLGFGPPFPIECSTKHKCFRKRIDALPR